MRVVSLIVAALLMCSDSFAQKHLRLTGFIQTAGGTIQSYLLDIEAKGNTITGYSITGRTNSTEGVRAIIAGYYINPSEMFIRETGLPEEQKSPFSINCYFSARLKLTVMMNGKERWNGPYESYQPNGTPCQGGVMTLAEPQLPETATKPQPVKVEPPKPPVVAKPKVDTPKPKPPPVVIVKPKDTPKVTVVKAPLSIKAPILLQPAEKPKPQPPKPEDSCQRSYDWNSDDFSFDIWDGYTNDGDVVSLSMSGRSLLQHVKLDNRKQHFNIPLAKGLNILYIYLHEEGYDPPNTPNLTMYDGNKVYEIAVSGKDGEVARLCIWRK